MVKDVTPAVSSFLNRLKGQH